MVKGTYSIFLNILLSKTIVINFILQNKTIQNSVDSNSKHFFNFFNSLKDVLNLIIARISSLGSTPFFHCVTCLIIYFFWASDFFYSIVFPFEVYEMLTSRFLVIHFKVNLANKILAKVKYTINY